MSSTVDRDASNKGQPEELRTNALLLSLSPGEVASHWRGRRRMGARRGTRSPRTADRPGLSLAGVTLPRRL